MAIGGVVINFAADTRKAIGNIKDLTKSLGNVDDDGTKPAKFGLGKLAGSLSTVLPIAGAVAGAAVGMAAGLWDAAQAAMEDKKQADNLARTLKSIPGITDRMVDANSAWIDSMELLTGLADTDWREAVSKLALATGDLEEAQKLAKLSADASVGAGKEWSSVQDAMAKAATGNTTALKRMFPWLDANKDGTLTYKEAVDGLTKAYGGAAKAAADTNPFVRLGAIWDQLKESVGQALVPLIDKFGKWIGLPSTQRMIKDLIKRVSDLATAFGDDLVKAVSDAVDWLQKPQNQRQLKEWAELAKDLAGDMVAAGRAVEKLIGYLKNIPKPPSWWSPIRGIIPDGPSRPNTSAASPSAAARSTGTVVNIHVEGVADPYAAARILQRQVAAYAKVQGRTSPGLAIAW